MSIRQRLRNTPANINRLDIEDVIVSVLIAQERAFYPETLSPPTNDPLCECLTCETCWGRFIAVIRRGEVQ